ncbi:MAG: hypothetical protein ACKVPX_08055 [Myxococcaceae bacterium]
MTNSPHLDVWLRRASVIAAMAMLAALLSVGVALYSPRSTASSSTFNSKGSTP